MTDHVKFLRKLADDFRNNAGRWDDPDRFRFTEYAERLEDAATELEGEPSCGDRVVKKAPAEGKVIKSVNKYSWRA